jgi:competence protein ComEC
MQPAVRTFGHRAPLLWIVLPLIAGLAAGRAAPALPVGWLVAAAALFAGLTVLTHARARCLWPFALMASLFLAGSARYSLDRARLGPWDTLPPREVRLVIRINRVFAPMDSNRVSGLGTVLRGDAHLRDLAGQRLYFSLALRRGEAPPLRSAVVSTIGVLVTLPRDPAADSFDGYLAAAGMNFRLTRGRVIAVEQPASAYYRFCAKAAKQFSATLATGVAEKRPELAAILRAMLLGQKHELSDEHGTLFMRSGTMHLFAISGLHIGMIAVALHALLRLIRLPRVVCLLAGLAGLWLYVEITGGAPSAVRAFIMVAMVESAVFMRFPRNPLAALAASALVVVLSWPMQVFSASFQLSYGIVAAILLLGLPLAEVWEQRWRWFRDLPLAAWCWSHRALDAGRRKVLTALAIGAASTLVSTIAGILFFNLFTPAALLANILLIPAAMFVVLAGFASILCGLSGLLAASAIFNHAAVLILWGIDAVVRTAVATPGAWRAARFASPWHGQVAFLILIITFLLGYAVNWRRERGSWWPPFGVVALTLIFVVEFL